jgi:3-hydroxyisobutyrate dehydrogenase-like beta-hydroxyacid dehydrogenase
MMKQKIGFIGLGNMGLPMAKNLINAGYHLQVYNRTIGRADELEQAYITRCQTPGEAAKNVEFIITMLAEDEVLKSVVTGDEGILKTMQKDAIHIGMSTIAPETSELLDRLHEGSGNSYMAAPVFGRPEAAAAKKLFVCTSGKMAVKQKAQSILKALGQGVFDFGENAGAANVLKIAGNFMILASMEMMAEAYTLAEKNGLDREAVSNFFSSTLFSAPIFQNYGKLIAARQYQPVGFKSVLGLKDARLALNLSQISHTPMPIANTVHSRLLSSIAKGWGEHDWVEGISRGVTEDAGL